MARRGTRRRNSCAASGAVVPTNSDASLTGAPVSRDPGNAAPVLTASTCDSSAAYMASASINMRHMDEDVFLLQSIANHADDSPLFTGRERLYSSSSDSTHRSNSLTDSFLKKLPEFEGIGVAKAGGSPLREGRGSGSLRVRKASMDSADASERSVGVPFTCVASPRAMDEERILRMTRGITAAGLASSTNTGIARLPIHRIQTDPNP